MTLQLTPELRNLFRQQDEKLQQRLQLEKGRRQTYDETQTETHKGAVVAQGQLDTELAALKAVANQQQEYVDQIVDGLNTLVEHRSMREGDTDKVRQEKADKASKQARMSRQKIVVKRKEQEEDEDPPDYPFLWNDISESTAFGRAVVSMAFEGLSATVIVANSVFIGYSYQFAVDHYELGSGGQKNDFIHAGEWAFFIFYVIELTLKLLVWRMRYFYSVDWHWNVFDFTLVVTAIYDVLIATFETGSDGSGSNMTWLRLLRLLKLLKMLRIIRVMRAFTELRLLLFAVIASARSLFWALAMLALIFYIFGLCFLQGVTGWLEEDAKNDRSISAHWKEQADVHFGSVSGSMLTLYMCISGGLDWHHVSKLLSQAGPIYHYLFIFYITFLTFAVYNVLIGLFVERCMATANSDKQNVMKEELASDQSTFHQILVHMESLEKQEHGGVAWQDFKTSLNDPRVFLMFEDADIDGRDAVDLFRILSNNFKIKVQPQAFMDGCSRIKGQAASQDIVSLVYKCKDTTFTLPLLMKYVEDSFKDIEEMFISQGGKASTVQPLAKRLKQLTNEKEDEPKTTKMKAKKKEEDNPRSQDEQASPLLATGDEADKQPRTPAEEEEVGFL